MSKSNVNEIVIHEYENSFSRKVETFKRPIPYFSKLKGQISR